MLFAQGYVHVARRLLCHPARLEPRGLATLATSSTSDVKLTPAPQPNPLSKSKPTPVPNQKLSTTSTTANATPQCTANSSPSQPPRPPTPSSTSIAAVAPALDPSPTPPASNPRANICDLGNRSGQFPLIEAVIGRHGQVISLRLCLSCLMI